MNITMRRKLFKDLNELSKFMGIDEFECQMYNYFEVDPIDTDAVEELMDNIGFEDILETMLSDYTVYGETPYTLYQQWYGEFAHLFDTIAMQDNGSAYAVHQGHSYTITSSQMLKMTEDKFRKITIKSKDGSDSIVITSS